MLTCKESKPKKITKSKLNKPTFNTGRFGLQLWLKLLEDFRTFEGPTFAVHAEAAFTRGLEDFRAYNFPEIGLISPFRFRAWAQLQALLKKFTFKRDAISSADRELATVRKYFETQERISKGIVRTAKVHPVVQRARTIARGILGPFDPEMAITNARFGKKSSIGCPLSHAYIDHKLTDQRAFTGSQFCYEWFTANFADKTRVLKWLVRRYELTTPISYETDYLNLMCVPKKWDTDRVITPLPLLDLFYSFGIGGYVTERLKDAGLDIRRLQQRHRALVKKFSLTRTHVTADLSSASDSITSELLNMVLPRDWYVALKPLFIRQVNFDGEKYYTSSILPMGNGATFPLETLVFYILIKAIGDLAGSRGLYSVYGDDLIYPSRIHPFVLEVFKDLHLVMNRSKTYCSYPFRESCGEDCYRGVPVRPFYLQGEETELTLRKYQAFLYGLINSVTRRWDPLEIPKTLAYILQELGRLGPVFRVPPSFPDTSGIKVADPVVNFVPWYIHTSPITVRMRRRTPSCKKACRHCERNCLGMTRQYSFVYLKETTRDRFIVAQEPYMLLSLMGQHDDPASDPNFWDTDFSSFHLQDRSIGLLTWRQYGRLLNPRNNQNGGARMKRRWSWKATVASRIGAAVTSVPGLTSDWN